MHWRSVVWVSILLTLPLLISGCGNVERVEMQEEPVVVKEARTEELPQLAGLPQAKDPIQQAPEDIASGALVMKQVLPIVEHRDIPERVEGELLIADFEGWPNNLGGEIGVYGSLEPDWDKPASIPASWAYGPEVSGYDPEYVHNGTQSFRLVNGLGLHPELEWGSFSMDMGPTIDATTMPKSVESVDVSGYALFTFWVRGAKGGERMQLLLRDAHALNYMPQVRYELPLAAPEWRRIEVPLSEIGGKVDLTSIDNIGLAFGKDVGNLEGDIIYIDDIMFGN